MDKNLAAPLVGEVSDKAPWHNSVPEVGYLGAGFPSCPPESGLPSMLETPVCVECVYQL